MHMDLAAIEKKSGSLLTRWIVLACCLLFLFSVSIPAHAQEAPRKTVRVGYYTSKGFQEVDADGVHRSGYSYEYLQKIASYTGWKYEYVSGSWDELYEMLKTGEIDLLGGVSDEPQRRNEVLYTDLDMVKETFYIYKDSSDTSMQSGVPSSFDGKKIGVVSDEKMMAALKNWCRANASDVQIVSFGSTVDCADAFNHQEIDGFVSADNLASGLSGITPVELIGKVPYYFCVASTRPDLLEELDPVLALINEQDASYLVDLRNRYTADTSISIFLSQQEQDWLDTHPQLRVGYMDDYLPYCDKTLDGSVSGLLKDSLTSIFEVLPGGYSPEILYTAYKDHTSMLSALHQGEVDLIFPVSSESSYAELHEYQPSSAVITAAVDLLSIKGYGDTPQRIAVNRNNQIQYVFSRLCYPDAEVLLYNDITDCLDAVRDHRVDGTLMEAIRAAQFASASRDLQLLPVNETCNFCFGVNCGSGELLRVLNHGISMLGDKYTLSQAYQYIGDVVTFSVRQKIRMGFGLVIALLALFLVGIWFSHLRAERKYREIQLQTEQQYSKTLEQKNNELEKLLENEKTYNTKLYRDALTGTYNRRYYEEAAVNSIGPAGVAIMDIDDFKICNDTYGHHAGDMALETVADAIRACIHKNDLLIRYGGDEFLLILTAIPADHFKAKLEKIRAKVRDAAVPGYPHLHLSLSIGGAMQTSADTMENVLRHADHLMYQAKERKNAVVVDSVGMGITVNEDDSPAKQRILVVDDSVMNRLMLTAILDTDYQIVEAENGQACLDKLAEYAGEIALVLLDINMPILNGYDVLRSMTANHVIEDTPVIMISSEDSEESIRKAYELGASDYVNRPFDAKVVYRRVSNTIKLYAKQRRLVQMVSDQIRAREQNTSMLVGILSQIVEFRNGESGSHVRHIRTITGLLMDRLLEVSTAYNISPEQQDNIPLASAMHDIGKIAIDERILNKPGRLTPEEFEIIKTHSMLGADMLYQSENFEHEPLLQTAYDIARWHHERWDGRGYPDGLKGDEIPISAQLVSIADVYDALTSERCYKKAYSHEQAIQMILNGECGAFNPVLLRCLTDIQSELKTELEMDFR